MSDEFWVPESKALKRFELTRANGSYHYANANAATVEFQDVYDLCKAMIAMMGQLAEGLALAQKDSDVTNDLIKQFSRVLPKFGRLSDHTAVLDEINRKLSKR
jgi:hypothetical protein